VAIWVAVKAAEDAEREHNWAAESVAWRARGLATVHLGDLESANDYLERAEELGTRAGSTQRAAEARMTLAYVLSVRGEGGEALLKINRTLEDLTGVARARAQAQRGAILHRLGRLDEALADYRGALPELRRKGDRKWVHRVLYNRGYLRVYLGEHSAAIADLHEAEALGPKLLREHAAAVADLERADALGEEIEPELERGLDLSLGFVHQNLGFAWTVAGDIPAALRYLDLAERCFRAHGSQLGELLVDRAEVLLSARLVPEALEVAQKAVDECEVQQRADLPQARLLLARAAELGNDPATALREANIAAHEFARQNQVQWAAIARLRALGIRLESELNPSIAIRQIQCEIYASEGRWPGAELDIQLAAAQHALANSQAPQARTLLSAASQRRHGGSTLWRAPAWHAEALLRRMAGNRTGATSAVRAGLRLLDTHVSTLGATDLRAYATDHRRNLVMLGLRIAFEKERIEDIFAWSELGRARHLHYPPARPPDDPDLANWLAELRLTVREIDECRRAGQSTHLQLRRQLTLERNIRDHHRRHSAKPVTAKSLVTLPTVKAALGDAALLEFVDLEGMMYLVCVTATGADLTKLGPTAEIRRSVDELPFALHRLARNSARRTSRAAAAAAVSLLRAVGRDLDAHLLSAIPQIEQRPLIIVPTGPLQALPWSLLPSCTGRPVTIAPSAALWHAASKVTTEPAHVIAVAGPRLPGAPAEVQAVAAIYGAKALHGEAATVQAVTSALDRAALAHLATKGTVRADNPLFSELQLVDGPLMVYDLERIQHAPHTVVVTACESGRSVVPVGDELMGMSATFLAQGTAQLIASVVTTPYVDTAVLMIELHRRLAAHEPAAAALAATQADLYAQGGSAMATAAGYVCFGAGLDSPFQGTPRLTGG
jgi:CHAT domain-containing protein/tetratricopeptide (TPR) repeat protein